MAITRRIGTVWIAALSLLISGHALASNAGKHDAETLRKEADEQPGASGAAAAVDRLGKPRALTPEEARALVDAMAPYVNQSSDGLTAVQQPNGVMTIDLQDRFQSVSLARRAADGSVQVRCVGTRAEAKQFLAADGKASAGKTQKTGVKKARAMKAPSGAPAPATAMTTAPAVLEEK